MEIEKKTIEIITTDGEKIYLESDIANISPIFEGLNW